MRHMIHDYDTFMTHLKRTGRMKLLPAVLRELKAETARKQKLMPRKETARENPALISGWRTVEDGVLTDRTAKGALIAMYRKVTN